MLEPANIVALAGSGVLLLGALFTFIAARGKTQSDAKTAADARIDARVDRKLQEAWAELDKQGGEITALKETVADQKRQITALKEDSTRRSAAFGRLFRQIAAQWPTPEGPDLDPVDIQIVEDAMPPAWVRRRPSPSPEETAHRELRTGPISAPPDG